MILHTIVYYGANSQHLILINYLFSLSLDTKDIILRISLIF